MVAGPGAGGCIDPGKDGAAGPRSWARGHVVANVEAQVSARRGAGMSGCRTVLFTGPPGDVLGSSGIIRAEVRPEAPNHWARGRTRNSPALLQSGPGAGEVVVPGRGPALVVKTVGE